MKRESCKNGVCAAQARTSRIKGHGHEPVREIPDLLVVLFLPLPKVFIVVSGDFGLSKRKNAEYAKRNCKQHKDLFHQEKLRKMLQLLAITSQN
jgi:hypothetical protein